jgi:hypothetical protein
MRKPRSGVNPLEDLRSRAQSEAVTDKDKEREERLAAALRDNLRRRKIQSRKLSEPKERSGDA